MTGSNRRISTDTALELLADQQRRRLLHHMADSEGMRPIDQLVMALGGDDGVTAGGNGDATGLEIELRHKHLPLLQAADVLVSDAGFDRVGQGPAFQPVHALLTVIDTHSAQSPPEST